MAPAGSIFRRFITGYSGCLDPRRPSTGMAGPSTALATSHHATSSADSRERLAQAGNRRAGFSSAASTAARPISSSESCCQPATPLFPEISGGRHRFRFTFSTAGSQPPRRPKLGQCRLRTGLLRHLNLASTYRRRSTAQSVFPSSPSNAAIIGASAAGNVYCSISPGDAQTNGCPSRPCGSPSKSVTRQTSSNTRRSSG